MKIIKNLSYIAVLFILVTGSCKKGNPPFVPSQSYFPNSVGDKFTYRVTDSLANKTFNVNVAVIGRTTLSNGQPVMIWIYTSPAGADTNYVFSNKDSAVFYSNRKLDNTTSITNMYHFPLSIGAKWQISFRNDTVTGNSTIAVNGKTYHNAFLIHEHGYCCNFFITKDQWFVPNIGLVKMTDIEVDFGNVRQSWELVSYNLNPEG